MEIEYSIEDVIEEFEKGNSDFAIFMFRQITSDKKKKKSAQFIDLEKKLANYILACIHEHKIRELDRTMSQKLIEQVDLILEWDPHHYQALNIRGMLYINLDEYERAIEDLSLAIGIELIEDDAYVNRGIVYYEMGDYQNALCDLDLADALSIDDPYVLFCRGNVYYEKEDFLSAFDDFYLAFDKGYSDNSMLLKMLLSKYRIGNSVETYSLSEELATTFAALPSLSLSIFHEIRGLVLYDMSCFEDALEQIHLAIASDMDRSSLYYHRGMIFNCLKRNEEALNDFSRALQLDKEYAKAYFGRAICYEKKNEKQRAFKDYANAFFYDPKMKKAAESMTELSG